MMKISVPADSPDAYVEALTGWQSATVQGLRATVVGSAAMEEVIKWGHLVYLSNGPVLLIRAEAHRVLFGFWRGKRLREIEARLKPGGKYEMATVELHENEGISAAVVRRLAQAAVALNKTLGNPTRVWFRAVAECAECDAQHLHRADFHRPLTSNLRCHVRQPH